MKHKELICDPSSILFTDFVYRCSSLTQLMWELLAYDGGGRAETRQYGHCKWGADSQAIDEVVQRVAQSDHPRHGLDAADATPTQPMAHHLRVISIL